MFKPLLRTIPNLSGNVQLVCTITDYNTKNTNIYDGYVRYAQLLPLSKNIFRKNIYVNLLKSSYEFDIKYFYDAYNDFFFKSNYTFDTGDFTQLDPTLSQESRDTDFEFGCKRVSVLENGKQFMFFAPVYIDDVNDIPDYFKIRIILKNSKNTVEKHIRIHLKGDENQNYLSTYLTRYFSKINTDVIFAKEDTKQAVYHGINLKYGGFCSLIDNVFKSVYIKHNTINNFDAIISTGFERNKLAIKQIMPLSFMFNVTDILTAAEQHMFEYCNMYISGQYYTKNDVLYASDENDDKAYIANPMCDFSHDYTKFNENIYRFDTINGIMHWEFGEQQNIMNVPYPGLREAEYIKYTYKNKLSTIFNRWKLYHSPDNHPYIINMSNSYSLNQGSSYRYGLFPSKFPKLVSCANNIDAYNNEYNIVIPLGTPDSTNENYNVYNSILGIASKSYKDSEAYVLFNTYKQIYNGYGLSWFNIGIDYSDTKKWSKTANNKTYYNGILYDLTCLYNKFPDMPHIDKFGVFVEPNINVYMEQAIHNTIFFSDLTIHPENSKYIYKLDKNCDLEDLFEQSSPQNIMNYAAYLSKYNDIDYEYAYAYVAPHNIPKQLYIDNSTSFNSNISNNCVFTYNTSGTGNFINPIDYGVDIYESNKYYNTNDLLSVISNVNIDTHKPNTANDKYDPYYDLSRSYKNSFVELVNICSKPGYIALPITTLSSVIDTYDNMKNEITTIFDNSSNIYITKATTPNIKTEFNAKTDISYSYISFNTAYSLYNVVFSAKTNIVNHAYLVNTIGNVYSQAKEAGKTSLSNACLSWINVINTYMSSVSYNYNYYPVLTSSISNYGFDMYKQVDAVAGNFYGNNIPNNKVSEDNDVIYVDSYNINKILVNLNKIDNRIKKISEDYKPAEKIMYAQTLNKQFLAFYVNDMYVDDNIPQDTYSKFQYNVINNYKYANIFKTIYIKSRHFYSNILAVSDTYVSLYDAICAKVSPETAKKWTKKHWINYVLNALIYNSDNSFSINKNISTLYALPERFDIVFRKRFYKLDNNLWNAINLEEKIGKYKDLYIYRLEQTHEYTNNDYNKIYNINNTPYSNLYKTISVNDASTRTTLVPMFKYVFVMDKAKEQLYADWKSLNISRSYSTDRKTTVFRYNANSIPFMYEITDTNFNGYDWSKDNFNLPKDFTAYTYDKLDSAYTYLVPSSYDGLQVYTSYNTDNTTTTFGYYVISATIDNLVSTFNAINSNKQQVKYIKYIDGINIINNNNYINSIFKLVAPFTNINLFGAMQDITTIVYPKLYTIPSMYSVNRISNSYNDYNDSYLSMISIKSKSTDKIYNYRYFNDMCPLFTETKIIENNWHLKFKNTNMQITDDTTLYNFGNKVIYSRTDNINKYDGERIFNDLHLDNNTTGDKSKLQEDIYEIYYPLEYKYYNDNKFINLVDEIEYEYPVLLTYNELIQKETFSSTLKVFGDIVRKQNTNMFTDNNVLFLYNKYKVQYDSQSVGLDYTLSEKKYKLIYKFILR